MSRYQVASEGIKSEWQTVWKSPQRIIYKQYHAKHVKHIMKSSGNGICFSLLNIAHRYMSASPLWSNLSHEKSASVCLTSTFISLLISSFQSIQFVINLCQINFRNSFQTESMSFLIIPEEFSCSCHYLGILLGTEISNVKRLLLMLPDDYLGIFQRDILSRDNYFWCEIFFSSPPIT